MHGWAETYKHCFEVKLILYFILQLEIHCILTEKQKRPCHLETMEPGANPLQRASQVKAWQSGRRCKEMRQSGRWGVAHDCNCQHMLSAIASLIRAQRYDMALIILEKEIELFLV